MGMKIGDFVQADGIVFRTRMGEVSVRVRQWRLLSKAISPLPVAKEQEIGGQVVRYSAFADVEERYRQRYADLAVNPEVRELFVARSKIVAALRRFFDENGFLETETPILQPIYGGAAARPFTTYHNQPTAQFYRVTTDNQVPFRIYGGQQDNSTVSIASRSLYAGIGVADYFDAGGGESAHIAFDPLMLLLEIGASLRLFGGLAGAGATMGTVVNIQSGGRSALSGISRASSSAIQPPMEEPTRTGGPVATASRTATASSAQRPMVPSVKAPDEAP